MYNIPELSTKMKQFGEYKLASYKNQNIDNGVFRSIIYKNDKIVCFSPPKSIDYTEFKENCDISTIIADEFIDGTMINVFYDDKWNIATRTIVGADCTFYSTKTFHDMFHETNINYDLLDKQLCYSFVLQHPENQIVVPIQTPTLYLIACYQIQDNVVISHPLPTYFNIPKQYTFSSYEEIEQFVQEQPYTFKGMMLKCDTKRSKIRNSAYEKIKKLRGNSPNMRYVYYTIRESELKHEYETYFPNTEFEVYEKEIQSIIQLLYSNYVECFIKKVKELRMYKFPMKHHMNELHMIYKNTLKPQKKYVNKKVVVDYVNSMDPVQLLHWMNSLIKT
jgi:hypothetical protein